MSFWEPALTATLYTIALFMAVAIALLPLTGRAPTDDTNETKEDVPTNEWSIDQ